MKKILLILVLTMLFAIPNAYANPEELYGWDFRNGWFDQPENQGKFTAPIEIYDNDLTTYVNVSNKNAVVIEFTEPIEEGVLGFYSHKGSTTNFVIRFYYNGKQVSQYTITELKSYTALQIREVIDKIDIRYGSAFGSSRFIEFDLFTAKNLPAVKNLSAKTTFESIEVKWQNPEKSIGSSIYLDGVLIERLGEGVNSYNFTNLKANTEYQISVGATYEDGESRTIDIFTKTKNVPNIPNDFIYVNDIKPKSVTLNFDVNKLPKVPKVINVYKNADDEKPLYIVNVYTNSTVSRVIGNLTEDTTYEYFVDVDYGYDNITDKKSVKFKTVEASREVIDLKAKADFDRVDLSWKLPEVENFEFARIYRKNDGMKLSSFSPFALSDNDNFSPIFETNGTFFNDLTVQPDHKYDYKVTTFVGGVESEGVKISVKTPKLSVVGGGIKEEEGSGDYTIIWDKPITGKIKVVVGGKEYKIVNASDRKITIAAKDMKFNILGDPDVVLIPVDEGGKEIGVPSKPGTGVGGGIIGEIIGGGFKNAELTPTNLLKYAFGLLSLVGGFVLLALAFRVVPKLTKTIISAFRGRSEVR